MKIVFSINCYYVKKENVNIRNTISNLKVMLLLTTYACLVQAEQSR